MNRSLFHLGSRRSTLKSFSKSKPVPQHRRRTSMPRSLPLFLLLPLLVVAGYVLRGNPRPVRAQSSSRACCN